MKGEVGGIGAVGFGRGMDQGSAVWYMGNLFGILANSEETGGRFGLVEAVFAQGHGAAAPRPPHREDEAWYVLEGEISFYIGDETHRATPGTFVFAPRGVPHSFVFETDVIRELILLAPGRSRGTLQGPPIQRARSGADAAVSSRGTARRGGARRRHGALRCRGRRPSRTSGAGMTTSGYRRWTKR